MAHTNVNYVKFQMDFETPFSKKGGVQQPWSLGFCVSETVLPDKADCETALDAFWSNVVQPITDSTTSWIGWKAYPINSSVATYIATESNKHGNGDGYASGGAPQQLEVCAMWEGQARLSSTNKPVFLRKHIHNVLGYQNVTGDLAATTSQYVDQCNETFSQFFGQGGALCDPTTGDVPAEWTLKTALYTRQLRKGDVRTPAARAAAQRRAAAVA